MAYKKIPKKWVSKKVFMSTVKCKVGSLRKLGKEFCDSEEVDENLKRSERSIRAMLNKGEMRADVLDAIGRFIDVEPRYLSGEMIREVWQSKLPKDVRWAIIHGMTPDRYPYGAYDTREASMRYLEDLLALHGVSRTKYKELGPMVQLDFASEIEDAIVPVIFKYFYQHEDPLTAFSNLDQLSVEIDLARDNLIMGDAWDSYGEEMPSFPTTEMPDDPFEEKYGVD